MCVSNRVVTVHNRHNIRDTDVGAWDERWLHRVRLGITVLRCVGSGADCPPTRCYGEVECGKDISTLVCGFDGLLLLKLGLHLSSCIVRLVTRFSPSPLIIAGLIPPLSFVLLVMRGDTCWLA